MTPREDGKTLPVSRIFFRGNPESPRRGDAFRTQGASAQRHDADLPVNDPGLSTSGRRLAYAGI